MIEKFKVFTRFTGALQFEAEIECNSDDSNSIKLGLAVKWAIKNNADLRNANLSYANLGNANLGNANLSYANLGNANLGYANLGYANLRNADLGYANLRNADLGYANLGYANLGNANLGYANLGNANLGYANLRNADLGYANLGNANLGCADLGNANLGCADLGNANLGYANLGNANLGCADLGCADLAGQSQPPQTKIIADGDLIVYKKIKEGVIKLRINANTPRSNATGRKCRAQSAYVLSLPDGVSEGTSNHDPRFKYRLNETVTCHEWSNNWFEECAGGIHFFITKEEAEAYT